MLQEILGLLAQRCAVGAPDITAQTRLREDLGADSSDVIELMMELEDHFGVTIANAASDEDALGMHTVDDLVLHFRSYQ